MYIIIAICQLLPSLDVEIYDGNLIACSILSIAHVDSYNYLDDDFLLVAHQTNKTALSVA